VGEVATERARKTRLNSMVKKAWGWGGGTVDGPDPHGEVTTPEEDIPCGNRGVDFKF
jgi:hypothetical protein